jgi:hypothetical protein
MSKWFDSLPEHTKIYLKGRPLWHDKDMAIAVSIGVAVGFVFGFICR